jgi:hypothetical protein
MGVESSIKSQKSVGLMAAMILASKSPVNVRKNRPVFEILNSENSASFF